MAKTNFTKLFNESKLFEQFSCQRVYEEKSRCNKQCSHCKQYYKKLEKEKLKRDLDK